MGVQWGRPPPPPHPTRLPVFLGAPIYSSNFSLVPLAPKELSFSGCCGGWDGLTTPHFSGAGADLPATLVSERPQAPSPVFGPNQPGGGVCLLSARNTTRPTPVPARILKTEAWPGVPADHYGPHGPGKEHHRPDPARWRNVDAGWSGVLKV